MKKIEKIGLSKFQNQEISKNELEKVIGSGGNTTKEDSGDGNWDYYWNHGGSGGRELVLVERIALNPEDEY